MRSLRWSVFLFVSALVWGAGVELAERAWSVQGIFADASAQKKEKKGDDWIPALPSVDAKKKAAKAQGKAAPTKRNPFPSKLLPARPGTQKGPKVDPSLRPILGSGDAPAL